MSKKLKAFIFVALTACVGAWSTQCPWIKRHWDANVAPLFSDVASVGSGVASVESDVIAAVDSSSF